MNLFDAIHYAQTEKNAGTEVAKKQIYATNGNCSENELLSPTARHEQEGCKTEGGKHDKAVNRDAEPNYILLSRASQPAEELELATDNLDAALFLFALNLVRSCSDEDFWGMGEFYCPFWRKRLVPEAWQIIKAEIKIRLNRLPESCKNQQTNGKRPAVPAASTPATMLPGASAAAVSLLDPKPKARCSYVKADTGSVNGMDGRGCHRRGKQRWGKMPCKAGLECIHFY